MGSGRISASEYIRFLGRVFVNLNIVSFEDPATELSSAADCVFMLLKNAGFNLVWDVRLEKGAVRLS